MSHSGSRVAMANERRWVVFDNPIGRVHKSVNCIFCDRCGRPVIAGDWPWCRGAGHEEDHARLPGLARAERHVIETADPALPGNVVLRVMRPERVA